MPFSLTAFHLTAFLVWEHAKSNYIFQVQFCQGIFYEITTTGA